MGVSSIFSSVVLVVLALAFVIAQVAIDDRLGITEVLEELPKWKQYVHKAMYVLIGTIYTSFAFWVVGAR